MLTISLDDLIKCIRQHLNDNDLYQFRISRCDSDRFKVTFLSEDGNEMLIETVTEDACKRIYTEICNSFIDKVKIIKIHAVCSEDYCFIFINNNVCIDFKVDFEFVNV